MARRQSIIYGFVILAMIIALALALLGLTGILPMPFSEEFSKKTAYAEAGDTPCLVAATTPVDPEGAKLQILNASSLSGAAATLSDSLATLGYEKGPVDNAAPFRGTFMIEAGPAGVDDAYTLARYFDEKTRIKFTDIPGRTITITIGESAEKIPTAEEIAEIAATSSQLTSLPECVDVSPEALEKALTTNTEQSGSPQSDGQSGEGSQS